MHPGIAEEVHLTKHSQTVFNRSSSETGTQNNPRAVVISWVVQLELPTSNFGSAEESDHASAAARIPCAPDHGAHHKGRKELRWAAERHLASKGHWHRRPKPYQHGICWMHMFRIFLMVRSVAGQLQRLTKELCCQGALLLVAGGDKYGAAGENLS